MTDGKTVRDISVEEFAKLVLESDPELDKGAKLAELDAVQVLEKEKPDIDKYTIPTGLSMGRARVREALVEKNSKVVKGLIVGCRDRFGSNAPVRVPILSSKGDHIEASFWGANIKYKDSKVELPIPSIVTARVLEGDYKGKPKYTLIALDEFETLTMDKAVEKLSKVARPTSDITADDEGKPVVLRGTISFVEPTPIFKDQERVGEHEIFLENSRDVPVKHMVLQISLRSENTANRVRVTFERNKIVSPTVGVTDMMTLVSDAVGRTRVPQEQASFVGKGLLGRDVIVVGTVSKYRLYNNNNYIEIGGSAIFDANPAIVKDWFSGKEKAAAPAAQPTTGISAPKGSFDEPAKKEPVKEEKKEPVKEEKKEPVKEEKKEPVKEEKKEPEKKEPEKKEEKKSAKKKSGVGDALSSLNNMKITDADSLKQWVTGYCLLMKLKPDALSATFVKQVTSTEIPDSVIEEVLEEMR